MTLNNLTAGSRGVIVKVGGAGIMRRKLIDMGMIPGAEVTLLRRAPMGDPIEVIVRGHPLSLRAAEAEEIEITALANQREEDSAGYDEEYSYSPSHYDDYAHPGIGEAGKFHKKDHEHPLTDGTQLRFAIVGQKNCGKTALFNALTGSRQHVGNFPGVTVDIAEGILPGRIPATVVDLPGISSLAAYADEEKVTRGQLLDNPPHCIINVVDAGNIERNLYLTMQLMELELPMVLAINMIDELKGSGGTIRVNEMERQLGIPVIPISASRQEGIGELMEHAIHIATYQEKPEYRDFCDKNEYGGAVHRCVHSIMHLVEDHAEEAGLSKRFVADRLADGDEDIESRLHLTSHEMEMIEGVIEEMQNHRGLDRHAAMADMRYSFVERLCKRTVIRPKESRERVRTRRIDRVLMGRWSAIPSFIVIMALVFWLTFDKIGVWLQGLLAEAIGALASVVDAAFIRWQVSDAVRSLVMDAIFGGVGSVLSFVPVIMVMFFFLSMLEDSGYMARIAFVSDKLLRKIGLSGLSIVPMLIGFGCSVPGVMSARTLPSTRDRRTTILMMPFMSCTAKIAVYGYLTTIFFPGHGGLVMISLYLLGIVTGVVVTLMRKWFGHQSEPAPFMMELPVYRFPRLKNVFHLLWEKVRDFMKMAFTVILVASVVVWLLQSFDFKLNYVSDSSDSILAWFSGLIAPIFKPLGLGDWRLVTSLIAGVLAKENIASTMGVLDATSLLTVTTAVPMLIFCLLYTPCVAAITAIKRELGSGWAAFVIAFQCVVAWIVAWIGYMVTMMIV
ncbi:MAG: ferrous iron transport protein B [Bacteroidales bacterium]|nr:ferrous iron transport protein B [Bacteroidales bacterium]